MDGYTPTVWAAGDTVTAAKLNKMEQGIADGYSSGGLIIHATGEMTAVMDKTWQEIYDAVTAGQIVVVHSRNEDEYGFTFYVYRIVNVSYDSASSPPNYGVQLDNSASFYAGSASGYPSYTMK